MPKIPVGSKVKFESERLRYTVQASDERFAVCNKPFNLMKSYDDPKRCTCLYTIIDFESKVRGPEDLIFGMGAETREDCEEMLERLNGVDSKREETIEVYRIAGIKDIPDIHHSEVSYRHRIPLDIERIDPPKEKKWAKLSVYPAPNRLTEYVRLVKLLSVTIAIPSSSTTF